MKPALLDVNALIALLDSTHVLHDVTVAWFRRQAQAGWATCAITQNGFVRIVSQPSYPNPVPTAQAAAILRQATTDQTHRFWPCDVQLCDPAVVSQEHLLGPKQVSDAYLLALAVARGGRFATFDQRVSTAVAVGAAETDLIVIKAD